MSHVNDVQILLVEDNPNDVELTLRAFEVHNLTNRVHVARDGAEALHYLFGDEHGALDPLPKVILLDLKLPKVDGLEVLRRIRSEAATHTIPVVVLTSSREERFATFAPFSPLVVGRVMARRPGRAVCGSIHARRRWRARAWSFCVPIRMCR